MHGILFLKLKLIYSDHVPPSGYTQPADTNYISVCRADGTWSSIADSQCAAVECGHPPQVVNSNKVSFTATTFGSNATVFCKPGFSPVEGFTLTCSATGSWEGPEMTCELIRCAEPPELKDATVIYNSADFAATVCYSFITLCFQEF